MAHLGIFVMRALSGWPLRLLRGTGWALGMILYVLAGPRRRVAMTNVKLCFAELSLGQRKALVRRHFVCFAQAWLDRAWLWHGTPDTVRQRLVLTGDIQALTESGSIVIFAPHFVGMDAGGIALVLMLKLRMTSIFTNQSNPVINQWILDGRQRFGQIRMFDREDGVKPIVSSLRRGEPLYLLPDMNFGPSESIFVPFYGHTAATVPSLSRFAKLGRAQVVPVITRMTRTGYEVQVMPPWPDFPTDDVLADTALMNGRLQKWIDTMPEQYYWVHKRFKTRPAGEASIY